MVATDFSEPSAFALQVALRFFSDQPLYLLHAFEIPGSGALIDLQRHVESFKQTHEQDLHEFLSSMVLPEADRQRLIANLELGHPAQLVREYVRDHGADLVVLGTRGRGPILEAFLGSVAKGILSSLPCDALVVRAPGGRVPRES
jgi:nucleotide-binding universal stress UspA family protein